MRKMIPAPLMFITSLSFAVHNDTAFQQAMERARQTHCIAETVLTFKTDFYPDRYSEAVVCPSGWAIVAVESRVHYQRVTCGLMGIRRPCRRLP